MLQWNTLRWPIRLVKMVQDLRSGQNRWIYWSTLTQRGTRSASSPQAPLAPSTEGAPSEPQQLSGARSKGRR